MRHHPQNSSMLDYPDPQAHYHWNTANLHPI